MPIFQRVQLSKIECACGNDRFCDRMKLVYRGNEAVIYQLKDTTSFTNDVEGVSHVNEEILEILKEKNKTAVRDGLLNLLTLQASALIYLRSSCNGTISEEHECTKGLEYLIDATCDLVTAAKELTEGSHSEAMKNVGTCPKDSKDKDPDLAYTLGMEIVKVLENIDMEHE
ncbi:unnamed protein product [Nippostrongylus brasiliensis]|uniref:PMEI domain-containing protein n=1 Tax=Nippostrongylus brasiliensis TaxID=27835 RepID=A0A0N4XEA2_NIPBR|nr:unnamed protein product [Nippostrongylus brasiliensis]